MPVLYFFLGHISLFTVMLAWSKTEHFAVFRDKSIEVGERRARERGWRQGIEHARACAGCLKCEVMW